MSQFDEPFDPYYQWLGIPPDEQPPNHYRLLGIRPFEENSAVIQNASDRQMVHLRTFQNGPRAAQSQKLLNEVAAAKLCLLSPDKRAAYDAHLRVPPAGLVGPPPPASVGPAPQEHLPGGLETPAGTPPVRISHRNRRSPSRRTRRRSWVIPTLLSIVGVVGALVAWQLLDRRSTSDATLVLEWPRQERVGALLQIDGWPVDLEQDTVSEGEAWVELALRPGPHRVQIERSGYDAIDQRIELSVDESTRMAVAFATPPGKRVPPPTSPLDRTLELAPDERGERDVTGAKASEPSRIVLQWPALERQGATLEVDEQPQDLSSAPVRSDEMEVVLEVTPGEHSVRIVRPGFSDFQAEVTAGPTETRIIVTWDRPAASSHSAAELQTFRENFRKTCERLKEYQQWAAEQDKEKKRELWKYLVAKMEAEAAKLPHLSPQQWAAYDETFRQALAGGEFVQARNMLTGTAGATLFTQEERQQREELIWNAAMKSASVEALVDYLKLCSSDGRFPSQQEQSMVIDRLSNAPEIAVDVSTLVERVNELQELKVLTPDAAVKTQVAIYVQASQGELGSLARALDLSDKILSLVPAVFESGLPDAVQHANALVDAVTLVRRKMLKETVTDDSARLRTVELAEGIKQVRDWTSQFGRVRSARQAIVDGQATPADHELVAFWLLQLGRCSDALPHLRASGDEALMQLAGPLPDAARDLLSLADSVEQESKKSKYSRRQEDALRRYVLFLRQSALDKNDTNLSPTERDALEKKLSAAESEQHESYNRRFPKDKWSHLAHLVTTDDLREHIEQTGGGQWTLLQDGSIATTGKSKARLELPVVLNGSYGVRFFSRRAAAADIYVHLPIDDTSVLFTLGAPARASGLELLDGKRLGNAANLSRVLPSVLSVARDGPVAVEIQVDIERASTQNAKRRQQTEGKDWVTIRLSLHGDKTPVVRSVSLAVSAVTPPPAMDTPPSTLSLSSRTEAVFGNLQLMRR
ncbi:MAG: hypothetical protein ACYC4U_23270 [Pirellulaceae bacterium]